MTSAHKMCAVLIAGSPADDTERSPLRNETPLHLTPLLGKTPLVYAIQALVEIGATHIVCLGWDEPQLCQAQLQSGQKWGCEIEWHTLLGAEQAFDRLADIAPERGPFLLATTCSLMLPPISGSMSPGILFESDHPPSNKIRTNWPWAWLDRRLCQTIKREHSWFDWPVALASVCGMHVKSPSLSLMDGGEILDAIPAILERQFPVVLDASEVEPGIYLSRNVIVHPTAEIMAPFYAGPDVEISKNCRIGPAVAISKRTHIGQNCHISNTQIGPDSWIGESLDIHECLVFRGVVWSRKHQARMTVYDALILAHGVANWKWQAAMSVMLERSLALLLLFVLMPIWLGLVIWTRIVRSDKKRIALIKPDISHMAIPTVNFTSWMNAHPGTRGDKHLLGFVLPNLLGVLTGQWLLLGTKPRTPLEWDRLTPSHQRWLAKKPCGLIQEEWVMDTPEDDELQNMVFERYQELRANDWTYKLGLLWRYLRQSLAQTSSTLNIAMKDPT